MTAIVTTHLLLVLFKIVLGMQVAASPLTDDAADLTPLFDGQSLDGWEIHGGKATYAVQDGAIVGTTAPNTENTFLCTTKRYANFELTFEFQCDAKLNSGVQFRSHQYAQPTTVTHDSRTYHFPAGRVHGYQAEIDPNAPARLWAAGVYDEARRGWLFPGPLGGDGPAFTAQGRRLFKPGEWNTMRIRCQGDHIRTWLNGELRADFHDRMNTEGLIGLQVHSVGGRTEPLRVRWRNLMIRQLTAID